MSNFSDRKFYKKIIAFENGKCVEIRQVYDRRMFHEHLKDMKLWYSPGQLVIDTPTRLLTKTTG